MSSYEGVLPDSVVRFPYWPMPAPGESLSSWVDRGAEEFDLERRPMWHRLGLVPRPTSVVPGYGIGLSAKQRASVIAATGATGEMLDDLLLTRYPALFRVLPMPASSRSEVIRWLKAWGGVAWSSRACSRCLAENGHVWLLNWRLPWNFACHRHERFLAVICPACGSLLQRRPLDRRQRWVCCSREGRHPDVNACGYPVAEIESPPAGPEAMDIQRRMDVLVNSAEECGRVSTEAGEVELGVMDEVAHLLRVVVNVGGQSLATPYDDVTKATFQTIRDRWSHSGTRNPWAKAFRQRVATLPSEFLPPLLDTALRLATSTDPVEEWGRLLDSSDDTRVSRGLWRPSGAFFPERHRDAFDRARGPAKARARAVSVISDGS